MSVVSVLKDVVCSVGDSIAKLLSRIAIGFKRIGPIALGLAGCQSEASTTMAEAPAIKLEVTTEPKADETPKPIGDFSITFYYVVGEDEVASKAKAKVKASSGKPANDNVDDADEEVELATIVPPEMLTIYTGTCEPIADVSKEFAAALALQGTGQLRDGRVVNVWGHCSCDHSPCFKVTESKWGTSGTGRPLQPFRTVAVDPKVVKLGTLLYVPILEGRTMPGRSPWGGFVHDGCVLADDTGGGIDNHQLDLFVGRKAYYLGVSGKGGSHAWAKHVPVFDGTKICERKGRQVARKSGAI